MRDQPAHQSSSQALEVARDAGGVGPLPQRSHSRDVRALGAGEVALAGGGAQAVDGVAERLMALVF